MTHPRKQERVIINNTKLEKENNEKCINSFQRYLFDNTKYLFSFGKREFMMYIFSNIVCFLRYINCLSDSNTLICFVSRDCYFLNKLYSKMYPDDKNNEYVYCSRNLFYSDHVNIINYIKRLLHKKKKTLWIDIQGSGDSHVYFFKKHFGFIPPKIFYNLNWYQLTSKDLPTDIKLTMNDYENITSFTKQPQQHKYRNIKSYCDFLEGLLRAPHKSIIGIKGRKSPIYKNSFDYQDQDLDSLIETYDYLIDKWCLPNNLNIRVDTIIDNINFKVNNNRFNYLMSLDIDETVSHDKYGMIEKIIKFCSSNKIKIIFITARWDPFYKNHNGTIINILRTFLNKLNYPIDVWFNPFSKNKMLSHHIGDVPMIKFRQLEIARKELKFSKEECFFIDDKRKNVSFLIKKKYRNCYRTEGHGIEPRILNKIKIIIAKIKQKKIIRMNYR